MSPLASPIFSERITFLAASELWSYEKLADYQLRRLRHLVEFVGSSVPFYMRWMSEKRITSADIRSLNDVRLFPTIDKTILQNQPDDFIPSFVNKSQLKYRTTGGSTGTPLTVYSDDDFLARDKANTFYYVKIFGLDIFRDKSVRLYGDKIDQKFIEDLSFGYVAEGRKLVMSCFHINEKTLGFYIKSIDEFGPTYIHTRPSSILPLAKLMARNNIRLKNQLKVIFCDGEYLTEGQCEIIENTFNCRVVNIYGHTEGAAVGVACQKSRNLHFLPQVGLIEVIGPNGQVLENEGEKGELIVTGFNNYMFPLIRYTTGDIVQLGGKKCNCGRQYPLIKNIEGRMQDYVVGRDGGIVPLAPAIFNYNDMDWKGVREFKVKQRKMGELAIQVELEEAVNAQRLCCDIKERVGSILGSEFSISIESVPKLEKTAIGKYRYLDQEIDMAKFFRKFEV